MDIEPLRKRPFLAGLLFGLVVWLVGTGSLVGARTVTLPFFGVGVVLAVFGEGWIRLAGQALAVAGATPLVTSGFDIVIGLFDSIASFMF